VKVRTYGAVGVGQLLGVVVVTVEGEGLFPEEGQHFGEGSSVVLLEDLTVTGKHGGQEVNEQTEGEPSQKIFCIAGRELGF